MKAVLIHQFGGLEVLRLEDIPEPTVAADEVLVRIHAASVNPVDLQIRAGQGMARGSQDFPLILGFDLSGVIQTIGADTARFKVGDQVYGVPRFPELAKTYAEFTLAPEYSLAFKPRNLTHVQAAAVPLAGLSALQALQTMNLEPGQTLLVHAADGGVGHFAVQLAKARGARIIGAASSLSQALVQDLGAVFFDYNAAPFEHDLEPVDAVLDTLGGEIHRRSFEVVKPGGWVVSVVDDAPKNAREQRPDIRAERIQVKPSGLQLEHLASLIEDGQLRPVLGAVFPLEQVIQAHTLLERNRVGGKVILEVRARSP